MSTESPSLASRAVGASAWTVGTRLVAKLIDLAMLLCLARFLGPAEFGLVAMAMAAVFIIEALFELPMAAALIRVTDLTPGLLHTAFTLSLMRGILIALLLIAVSWPLASFNDEPRLTALLGVLALAPALRGLVNPRMVEFARVFNFRPDALMELSGKLVAFAVSVIVAITTRSYWAIAAATVCGPFVSTLLSYYIAPLRPRLTLIHWAQFSNLIGWTFVSQMCGALNWQIDRLLLPRFTSNDAFGRYAMGRRLAEIPMQALISPLIRPSMAILTAAGDAKASRYVRLSHAIALVMVPIVSLSIFWPEVLIRVALGPEWTPAAEWLRAISAIALLGLPTVLLAPLSMTLDRTRLLAGQGFIELLVRLPLVWFGAVRFGILGAVTGSAVASAVGTVVALIVVRRLIGTSMFAQITCLCTPLIAMLPAGAVLWLTKPTLLATTNLVQLLTWAIPLGALYGLVYLLSVLLAWLLLGRPAGLEQHLVDTLRNRIKRSNNAMEFHGT